MPEVERITLTPAEAAESLSISLSTFRRHVLPQIKSISLGNCRLISVAELSKWAEDQGTLDGQSTLRG